MDFVVRPTHHRAMAQACPRSPYDREGGLFYFPRMLDKIRLRRRGELPADYHANLGKGFDRDCCAFFRVEYDAVAARVGEGLGDAEVFAWCCTHGRRPDGREIEIWNEYMRKRGWNDEYSERLRSRLEGLGMAARTDVPTMFDLLEVDEGRPPGGPGSAS